MIQLAPNMTIFVAVEPVDGRRQIDGLAAVCRERLGADPMSGAVYVFVNKGRTSIRALCFDGHGYWLCTACLRALSTQLLSMGQPGVRRYSDSLRCHSAGQDTD